MYYHTKLETKRISSLKDTVEIVISCLYGLLQWPDFENSKSIFLYNTAHANASRYQVWKQNVWWFRRYHLDKHYNFDPSLWPWPWMQQSILFHRTLWFRMMYHQTKFGCQGFNSSENRRKSHILIIWALAVTLTLQIATTIFFPPHESLAHDAASPY